MQKMKLAEIASILEAKIVCGTHSENDEIKYGFSSDLMSDVLTLDIDNMLLITGLANVQTIRTAEMSDIKYIVFVRNKKASADILKLATENGMIILESPFSLFKASGLLFNAGLKPVY